MSKKLADNEVIFVESLTMDEPKANDALGVIKALAKGTGSETLATKRKNAALVVLTDRNLATEKSFRNFGNVEVVQAKDINPVDLLTYKYVVVADPTAAIEIFQTRVGVTTPKSN